MTTTWISPEIRVISPYNLVQLGIFQPWHHSPSTKTQVVLERTLKPEANPIANPISPEANPIVQCSPLKTRGEDEFRSFHWVRLTFVEGKLTQHLKMASKHLIVPPFSGPQNPARKGAASPPVPVFSKKAEIHFAGLRGFSLGEGNFQELKAQTSSWITWIKNGGIYQSLSKLRQNLQKMILQIGLV